MLSDTLPTLGNLTSWVIPAGGDPSGTCAITGGTALKCSFGDLPTPKIGRASCRERTEADVAGGGANKKTATVTGANVLTKADMGDTNCADYTIVKTPDGGTFKIGEKVRFTMVVTATEGTP